MHLQMLFIFFLFLFHESLSVEIPETKTKNKISITDVEELNRYNLEQLIIDILYPRIKKIKCFVLICDSFYSEIFTNRMYKKFKMHASYYMVIIDESEDLLMPYNETQNTLGDVKKEGCKFYVILIANGLQASRLLRFGDRYRVLNTRANFIMLYDLRLFKKNLHYLWTRIVNVIFIREYGGYSQSKKAIPWFELSTVPFPSPILGVFIPHKLDSWRKGHFRSGVNLFRDKTNNLKGQTLKVVAFQHIPAVVKIILQEDNTTETNKSAIIYSGLEIEILQTLADQMNFETSIFEPENADFEKWGHKQHGTFSGLLGEMVKFNAEIALGDLYYSPYHLDLMDLSIPYNTECLTFLTPESTTDNAWKTLMLPFKLYMWLTVLLILFIIGFVFHFLAVWQRHMYESSIETNCIVFESNEVDSQIFQEKLRTPLKNLQIKKKKLQLLETEEKPIGLYLFEDYFNTFLYAYSVLLLVSLPKLPDGWSLRVLIGWYFLYTTLVVVSYKASMTAILANPAPKITIDNLEQLYESNLACGGWAETVKNFFLTSLDPAGQKIGEKFEQVNDSDIAVENVALGQFAYYENEYFLKALSVKRQLLVESQKEEGSTVKSKILHLMANCVINMPISIGLQKNSPIKNKMDAFIRRVIEGGFVKKWLNDVMRPTLTSEMIGDTEAINDLMTLRKLYAGIAALFIGYLISTIALITELFYWQFVVKKHPYFDKYSNTIIYDPVEKTN